MKRQKVLLGLCLWAMFLGAAFGQTTPLIIPQVGHGLGFETSFSFMNLSSTTNRLEVTTYDGAGNPVDLLARAASPFETTTAVDRLGVEIPVDGSRGAVTAIPDPSKLAVGYAVIRSTTSAPFSAEVVFRRFSSGGQLLTTTSVLPQPLTRGFSCFAYSNAFTRSGIAVVNPVENGASVTLRFTLTDRLGAARGIRQTVLAAGAKLVQFLDEVTAQAELFPEIRSEEFSGTLEVEADFPVAVSVIKTEGPGSFFATQSILPPRPSRE